MSILLHKMHQMLNAQAFNNCRAGLDKSSNVATFDAETTSENRCRFADVQNAFAFASDIAFRAMLNYFRGLL